MLSRQAAEERLKACRIADWTDQRSRRAGRLPGALGPAARALLDRDPFNKPFVDRAAASAARARATSALAGASSRRRRKLFEAVFAKLAPYVEKAWDLLAALPYTSGATRKPFRAPGNPKTYFWKRYDWLRGLARAVSGYDQDATWFAAWAPYLGWGAPYALGNLFAAAIEAGGADGQAVFDTLVASAKGEHEVGAMGRHVPQALLVASREEGWDFIEQLLLAAQRQEGVRQVILETVDESHPQAFRRMLRLIVDNKLTRFSATVRAADVWLGHQWESTDRAAIDDALQSILLYLDDKDAREKAFQGDDAGKAYLAAWTMAYEDAMGARKRVFALLKDGSVERRLIGAHILDYYGLLSAQDALVAALDDDDLRVSARALTALHGQIGDHLRSSKLFERLEQVLPRYPAKERELEALVWPWLKLKASQQLVIRVMLASLGKRPATRLVRYLPRMAPAERSRAVHLLGKTRAVSKLSRDALLALVGDRSHWVRESAIKALGSAEVNAQEARQLEGMLTRKTGDLRRAVIGLLINQDDEAAFRSAERLLGQSRLEQRLGGLTILREMLEADRAPDRCRGMASQFKRDHPQLKASEEELLERLLADELAVPTLDDALGLMDPRQRTPPRPPRPPHKILGSGRRKSFITPAAKACVASLDQLIHELRSTPVTLRLFDGTEREELLGNVRYGFPAPNPALSPAEDRARLPLVEHFERWFAERSAELRDADGLELVRASGAASKGSVYGIPMTGGFLRLSAGSQPGWLQSLRAEVYGVASGRETQYPRMVLQVLAWLNRLHPAEGAVDVLLDGVELTWALTPVKEIYRPAPNNAPATDYRSGSSHRTWEGLAMQHRRFCPDAWTPEHHARLIGLLRWIEQPAAGIPRHRPAIEHMIAAFDAVVATEADMFDLLLGPRTGPRFGRAFSQLWRLTPRKPLPHLTVSPRVAALVERCRERILEVELARGEMPTAASRPALSLRSVSGSDKVVKMLTSLGREKFVRGWTYDSQSKRAVFSYLIRVATPGENDSPDEFAKMVADAGIAEKRLVELAVYAPQWAAYVERALEWEGLADAVWWIHAHTKDSAWRVDREIRELWQAEISDYTPLTGPQLLDGAVDVQWFHQAYTSLGEERWDEVYKAAKLASGGGGHKRAQLFADAMLSRADKSEILSRIANKRHKDAVRALGLIPLESGRGRDRDLLERYRVLQEFQRTSSKFGSQRRTSEKLAVTIGMANLASTAGYADPIRLEWAMETRETTALVGEAKPISEGDVKIALVVDGTGDPELQIHRGDKRLKSIPAALMKDPRVVELKERRTSLKRQSSRTRKSLEHAMTRGDELTAAEVAGLMEHPLLAPMLRQLVLLTEDAIGYPVDGGRALERHNGDKQKVSTDAVLRVAHPYDLLKSKEWHAWQQECFAGERVQAFKQVFRELYVVTETEKQDKTVSRRYAGHQLNPKQAMALLTSRGWVGHPHEGIKRTFHKEGISAWLDMASGILTPAEVEPAALEGVWFTTRGEWKPLQLVDTPPRLFSEVMRDVDLVVSVAHLGGVDPEASASTLEMRGSLLRETIGMLGIKNVELKERHALIEGSLSSYTVHLGSAVVHQQPGGAVCMVPVHSQHRGRLFLPFVDPDPKTAEVVSKVLMLARDKDIKDPTILEQIVGGR